MLKRFLRKAKNKKQKNRIIEISNVIQYDEMGYPLRLVMIDLGDGTVDHVWRDIRIEELRETDVELEWTKL